MQSRLAYSLLAAILVAAAPPIAAQGNSSPPKLNDAQVAHVAVTANSIDIDAARVAQRITRNPEVRAFAATMVTDHSAVNSQAAELAGKLGVTPMDNPVSRMLTAEADSVRTSLEKLTGSAFDRAYMEREVAYHQAVLDALDGLLIPSTSNAELKRLLQDVRPAIAAHLEHAKMLRAGLQRSR